MTNLAREPFVCLPVRGQSFWDPTQPDARRTALREAAYIRRTKFVKDDLLHDFASRSEDLFMLTPILPKAAPAWVRSPFLRWKLADEAATADGDGGEISAWHVCGDLPAGCSRGEWLDEVEELVRRVLPAGAVAEIAGHIPVAKFAHAHAHVLVASRYPSTSRYGRLIDDLPRLL